MTRPKSTSSLTVCARKLRTGRIGWSARPRIDKIAPVAPAKGASSEKRRIVSIAESRIHPIGRGTGVGKYVKRGLQAISKIKGLECQVAPMATILEAEDIQTILKAVEASHSALRAMGAKRISWILRIDEAPGQA